MQGFHRPATMFTVLVVAFLAWNVDAVAAVPYQFNYQGFLRDSDANPVSGLVNFQFYIYPDSTGGTPCWGPESFLDVEVVGGFFELQLGSSLPIDPACFDGSRKWLEIWVSGAPLAPRKAINSVPYAFHAAEVPASGGLTRIAASSFSAVPSVAISGLGPDTHYLLVIRVKHGGSQGRYLLRVNGDTGSNYQYCVRWTGDNGTNDGTGSGGSGNTTTYGMLSPAGGDGGGTRANEHWNGHLHISSDYNDPSWTLIRQYTVWDYSQYGAGAMCADVSGVVRHHGSASVSSITIYPTAGDMTGEYALYKYE